MKQPLLTPRCSRGAVVQTGPPGTVRLEIPAGGRNGYRLAQVDDYTGRRRKRFPWHPPVDISLRASVSAAEVPGTWGFGFWNAPVQFSPISFRVDPLPALPQAAWFFFASRESHISFRDDLPGRGFMAQTYRSANLSAWLLLPAAGLLPLLILRPIARRLRRLISKRLVSESGSEIGGIDPCEMHTYRLTWTPDAIRFGVDGQVVHESSLVPRPPLGLVIWIDNQYAAFRPTGTLGYGLLASDSSLHLEIADLEINGRPALIESPS